MSRAEELILKSRRMVLIEPVMPFVELKLTWLVKNEEEDTVKEVDLLHTYSVNPEEDYVGMQIVETTTLPYEVDYSKVGAAEDVLESHPKELYQVRIPVPSYVKEGEEVRLTYSFPGVGGTTIEHSAVYVINDDMVTVCVVGHSGVSTSKTEQEAEDLFVKLTDETFVS